MTEVVIGSAGDRLVVRADGPEPVVRSVVARLESDGLLATRSVHDGYDSGSDDLVRYSDEMVRTGGAGPASRVGGGPRRTSAKS